MHENEGSWAARMRLAELGDSSVDHTWLWRLSPRHGSTLEADEYVDSVRFRLGCAGPAEPTTCAACNSGILDTGAAHASCCALGEATRGHNAVSSLIHAAAQQCDHTSEMEVPGLIPGTDLRPADVLTSALGNAYTALDVSICSPHASEAGVDCTQSRVQAKLEHYGPHLAALHRQNISYTPIVWSAYGRDHLVSDFQHVLSSAHQDRKMTYREFPPFYIQKLFFGIDHGEREHVMVFSDPSKFLSRTP